MANSRPKINFKNGTNTTVVTADNPGLNATDVTINSTGGDPATDTKVWMPLTTTTSLESAWFPLFDADGSLVLDADGNIIPTMLTFTGVSHDELVWDDSDSLIPTLVPLP